MNETYPLANVSSVSKLRHSYLIVPPAYLLHPKLFLKVFSSKCAPLQKDSELVGTSENTSYVDVPLALICTTDVSINAAFFSKLFYAMSNGLSVVL